MTVSFSERLRYVTYAIIVVGAALAYFGLDSERSQISKRSQAG